MTRRDNGRSRSIGVSILVTTSALVLAIVGIQGFYLPRRHIEQLTAALEQKAMALAKLTAYVAAPSLEFDDAEAAVAVLRGMADDPDFVGAILLAEDGTTVKAELRGAQLPTSGPVAMPTEPTVTQTDGRLVVVAPVASKGGGRGMLVVGFSRASMEAQIAQVQRTTMASGAAMIAIGIGVAFMIARSLRKRLDRLVVAAERVARGDLTRFELNAGTDDEIGRTASAFTAMLESQRRLVRQIAETAVQLTASAGEFAANARQQEHGASAQTTAVTQTQRTMQTLLDAGRVIANTAQGVLENAERAQHNSQVVSERIAMLAGQTQRITEILEVIKEIANKSELLALNAALEGSKAGEAGKGFSLVAGQMQRLAENVMGAVRDIKELTAAIETATQATVLATEESTHIAADTTRSSRQITHIIQQQQAGTEQVSTAMELVSDIAAQSAHGAKEIVSSSGDLRELTERLQVLVGQFRLDDNVKVHDVPQRR